MLVRRTEDIAIWADENCCLSSEEEIKATVQIKQVVNEDRFAPVPCLMGNPGQ